jgi:hypothetical protein
MEGELRHEVNILMLNARWRRVAGAARRGGGAAGIDRRGVGDETDEWGHVVVT